MKRILLTLTVSVFFGSLLAQTGNNPFAKLGYKKHIMYTSSKGEFEEFHDMDDVVEIGSALFNTKTNQIVGFIDEQQEETEVASATAAMSIDPLCEKYYWITPYAFCSNNPIRFVDPDGLTHYAIDSLGYIAPIVDYYDKNGKAFYKGRDDEFDMLFAGDKSIKVNDQSILSGLATQSDDYNGNYVITSSNDVGAVFIFAATNTVVEWGLDGYRTQTGNQYVLMTSHNREEVAAKNFSDQGLSLSNQIFDIHSHPGPNGTRGASGDFGNRYMGDMARITRRYYKAQDLGVSLPLHYVYHKESKNLYNYTPWNSSIFIKNIKNNQGLRFLIPKQ